MTFNFFIGEFQFYLKQENKSTIFLNMTLL